MASIERIKTNHLLLDELGLWDEFKINKAIDSSETQKYYQIISNLIDDQLKASRQWLSSKQAKDYFYQEAEYQQEVFQSLENEWENILSNNYDNVDELIQEVYNTGKRKGYNDIQSRIVFTDTDRQALDFVRQYNFSLIRNLSSDLRNNIKNTITAGIASGENPYSLANKIMELSITRLPGSTLTPKQRAVMIAKTEVSRVQNTGILQSYVNEGYTEVKILTAEDNQVCRLCLANAYEFNDDHIVYENHGKERVHKISKLNGDSKVPLHPNCRCTYIAVWETRKSSNNPDIVDLVTENNINPVTGKQFSESAINEYNRLKNDKNIECTLNQKINFHREDVSDDELFIKYYFKDTGITIYKSAMKYGASVTELYEFYKKLPNKLSNNCKEIVISNQVIKNGDGYVGGYVIQNTSNKRVHLLNDDKFLPQEDLFFNFTHELAHLFDGRDYMISNSQGYIRAFKKDLSSFNDLKFIPEKNKYITDYAHDFTTKAKIDDNYKHRVYSEDFAECVATYFMDRALLKAKFHEKEKFINNIFKIYD